MERASLTIVEGAGGWRVPLNGREFLSDLPRALNMPVILVVGVKLGCINHAQLTVEAIERDGLSLAGWVANRMDRDMPVAAENISTLRDLLPAPCLGQLAWAPGDSPDDCAAALSIDTLIG
jgi:dethiobiotin synthetase